MIAQVGWQPQMEKQSTPTLAWGVLQRACACGQHTSDSGGECKECKRKRESKLQRSAMNTTPVSDVPTVVQELLRSPGQPLEPATRAFMEPRFNHDFSGVRVHTNAKAAGSARAVNAEAYTFGQQIVFGEGKYAPETSQGKYLLAHELTHTIQQGFAHPGSAVKGYINESIESEGNADAVAAATLAGRAVDSIAMTRPMLQRRAAPYIKKITVHLTPPQAANLEWEGIPPADATGSDHFIVSTGKGYGDPGDPPGTCRRQCCSDPLTQCAPPWNRPTSVGACCTYYGNNFWTGTPREEHNGWKWWTPIQPYYSLRSIALHQHSEVTGQPIGHGCVRMDEPNAKRIYDYSNGRRTNVTTDGRAAPVICDADRQCGSSTGSQRLEQEMRDEPRTALFEEAISGLEGVMS